MVCYSPGFPTYSQRLSVGCRSVRSLTRLAALAIWSVACSEQPPPEPAPVPPAPLEAQTFCIAPDVRTPEGEPVPSARVSVDGHQGVTNSDGFLYLLVRGGRQREVTVTKQGFLPYRGAHDIVGLDCNASIMLTPLAPAPRKGMVQLTGRATVDADGLFLATGTSFFWAIAGERDDPGQLDRNLAALAGRVQFIRLFADVGGSGYWQNRDTRAADAGYWEVVDRLFARLRRHALRAQVTIFAGSPVFQTFEMRSAFVDRWVDFANAHPDQVILLEISNEAIGAGDLAEIRGLAERAARQTDVLVTATSVPPGEHCRVYAEAGLDVWTEHYQRVFLADGPFRPIRQPWGAPGEYDAACPGQLPTAWNGEPIGIQSSVQHDDDPRHHVLAAIVTFIAGNAGYVLHSGAGVRGLKDERRAANLMEQPTFAHALEGLEAAEEYLPPDLPNWDRCNHYWACHPFDGVVAAINSGRLVRAYAALRNERFVVAVIGARGPMTLSPKEAAEFDVRDPLDGRVLARYDLRPGQTFTLDAAIDAYVLVGRRR
jgi:hypothetical protein